MQQKTATYLVLVTVLITFILFIKTNVGKKGSFASEVKVCNRVATQLRFSCYRAAIERHYKNNPRSFIERLKSDKDLTFESKTSENNEITYANFGTNCHTFYHASGDFVATHIAKLGDSVKKLLSYGPTTCTNAYTMGLYKRLAIKNNYPMKLLQEFWKVCKTGAENQCAHEIGHILHDKYGYSILQVLDGISAKEYNLIYPTKFRYTTFSKADYNAPFEDCRAIVPEKKVAQCYTGIGHNLFLFSEFSSGGYKDLFKQCEDVKQDDKEYCYSFFVFRIGINEAATKFLSKKYEEGRKTCSDGVGIANRQDMLAHCYRGVGGGIGLWIDSEYKASDINDQNLPAIKKEFLKYANLCEESPTTDLQDECYAGLMGTKFSKYYKQLGLFHEKIEKLLPQLDTDFEVVG